MSLVGVRPNGTAAFRNVGALRVTRSKSPAVLADLPAFSDAEYRAAAVDELRASMKQSLVAAGVFEDEAAVMLQTWSDSHFRTPGLRIFYLVPREWTDYFLPLDISVPTATRK